MPHYFTNDDGVKKEYELACEISGVKLFFTTSDGVFSKKEMDDGTMFLINAVLPLMPGKDERKMIDLGCGYGAIGVVFAKMRENLKVVMVDINEKAVELARNNIVKNGVESRSEALVSDGLPAAMQGTADYVITNPPFRAGKQTVLKFFTDACKALRSGGDFFAVLRKQQGAESYIKAIAGIFGKCDVILKKKGYVVVKANKEAGTQPLG